MNDGLAHADQLNEGVAAGLIKKELDDRLTEEQRRKKQVYNTILFKHSLC